MRSFSESTQVGFRLRGIAPGDLPYQPPAVRRMFWGWVVEFGLRRKDWELSRGLGADGQPLKTLEPASIKHRKSEVGPTDKTAPPLEPSWGRSRVRSLLNGRAHTDSAEFFWGFDAVSGRSFAYVLRAQREAYGRDVFGLSPAGVAAVKAKAWQRWRDWLSGQHPQRPAVEAPPAKQLPRYEAPAKWMTGRTTGLETTTAGAGSNAAFLAETFGTRTHTGFRRLNLPGEKWKAPVKLPVRRIAATKPVKVSLPAPLAPPPTKPVVVPQMIASQAELLTLAKSLITPVGRGYIDELRAASGLPQMQFNEWFEDLVLSGKLTAYQLDNPREAAMHEAGMWFTPSGSPRHIYYVLTR